MDELFALPVKTPKMMLADKGYDGDEVRTALLMKGVLPVIPPKSNRKQPIACDFVAYKDRNRIERMFNRLKQARRIANPIRQDRHLIPKLPEHSGLTPMADALCQHDLDAGPQTPTRVTAPAGTGQNACRNDPGETEQPIHEAINPQSMTV